MDIKGAFASDPDGWDGPMRARVIDPLAVDPATAAAWDALADDASEPNAFAERWCLQSALHLFDPARTARLVAVEDGQGRLAGVMPIATAARYGRVPLRHLTGWSHANHFHGAPLVRAGAEAAFWNGLLDWCADEPRHGPLLHLARLTAEGPLHRALESVAAARGNAVRIVHREQRAMLASALDPQAYWDAAMRGKKRKELRRQANRLAELGSVQFTRWDASQDPALWTDAFLDLETRGWKGRAGSAMASAPATRAWFGAIIAGAASAGRLDMRALTLDERPLAMLINFLCPRGGFSFKTAFDEDYARFSPGVLLQQANLDLLTREGLDWVDSCAVPDHPMIDSIWTERRALVWLNVAIGDSALGRLHYRLLARAEDWRHRHRPPQTGPIFQDNEDEESSS